MRVSKFRAVLLLSAGLGMVSPVERALAGESPSGRQAVSSSKDLRWAGVNRKRSLFSFMKKADAEPIVEEVADVTESTEPAAPVEIAEPVARGDVAVVPSLVAGCPQGQCTPYYRNRPVGKPNEQKRIMMHNRLNEPEWYRYYRCQHYGHYPTQWAAWPEGFMACRRPHPGPHPYDLFRPPPRNSTGGERPLPPSEPDVPPARQEPERLPEPGSLNVPPPPPPTP